MNKEEIDNIIGRLYLFTKEDVHEYIQAIDNEIEALRADIAARDLLIIGYENKIESIKYCGNCGSYAYRTCCFSKKHFQSDYDYVCKNWHLKSGQN